MSTYPTKLMEVFASRALQIFYQRSVADAITNQEYEGQIRDKSSILNVLTFSEIASHDYTGANMTVDDPTESNAQLVTDQAKYFYFRIKDYDTFRSYIESPEGTILEQIANELKKVVDIYVLSFWSDVAAGNRIGTDYTTGTVAIDAAGNVTGTGTTFTAAMVGKPFQATGHTEWYRVKTFNSATSIAIEDDKDDEASAYTGGAVAASSTYTIQANTAIQVTKSNIYQYFTELGTTLTNREIPVEDRWAVVPARIAALIRQSPEYVGGATEGAREAAQNGRLPREFAGFSIYEVSDERIAGDHVNGYHVLAGHKSAICMAMGLTEQGTEDLIGNFGKAYKSLYVYGAKVPDVRRKALAELFCKL